MRGNPDDIGPVANWQWCTGCGNLWATGWESGGRLCSCEADETELFPEPAAVEAAYRVGGGAAVWVIERYLYLSWRRFPMGRSG